MAIQTCKRCGKQTAKFQNCGYCKMKICYSCIKNSKRKKIGKRYICKTCWTDMKKRKKYKSEN